MMAEYPITSLSLLSSHPLAQQYNQKQISTESVPETSHTSIITTQRRPTRTLSRSRGSRQSMSSAQLRVRNGNTSSTPNGSSCTLSRPAKLSPVECAPQKTPENLGRENHHCVPKGRQSPQSQSSDTGPFEDVDLNSLHIKDDFENSQDKGVSFDLMTGEALSTPRQLSDASQEIAAGRKFNAAVKHPFGDRRPFTKWLGSMRQQQHNRTASLKAREDRWTLDESNDDKPVKTKPSQSKGEKSRHQKSSSWSRLGLFSAPRSAVAAPSVSSIVSSQSQSRRKIQFRRNTRNMASDDTRVGDDDDQEVGEQPSDPVRLRRAMQRRRIIKELIISEEGYIADLKVLLHVYVFVLDSAPKLAQATQPGISHNVKGLLDLHEEMLMDIKAAVVGTQTGGDSQKKTRHVRWRSVDSEETMLSGKAAHAIRRSLDLHWPRRSKDQHSSVTPQMAAEVAKVFERMLPRFFIYEEYGSRYETMLQDMASLSKTMPNWSTYERGIESLVNSLIPRASKNVHHKKGLTFDDLLIKPIQRVCRYPLLFSEMYKQISTVDDPNSKAAVGKVCGRLRETAAEINKAINDQQTQSKIQRSWRLQDLLVFPDTYPNPFAVRLLGHASLCGVLYVTYQSKDDFIGSYMLCALFASHLLFAVPKPAGVPFEIVAIITLGDMQIENSDSGRGLQCHTAPFSWKVLFQSQQQIFEMLLCACTGREEEQWKTMISAYAKQQVQRGSEGSAALSLLSFENSVLCLEIQSLGPVFGLPGSIMRRQSIQRAVTVNSRKNGCQIIVKNTYSFKETPDSPMKRHESLSRSESLLSTHRIPTLTPRRSERQRMEQNMSAVWTKDLLPYPGMTAHRGGHLIRTSANSLMRRFSIASMSNSISTTYSTQASTTGSRVMQRNLTYGSIAQSSPYKKQSGNSRANQTDGAASPIPENSPSYPETYGSTLEYQGCQEPAAIPEQPSRILDEGEDQSENLRTISGNNANEEERKLSESSTIVVSRDLTDLDVGEEIGQEKLTPRRRKGLFKAFSAEAIRKLFH